MAGGVDGTGQALVVHTRTGVIEVPLTGNAGLDEMLRRLAARGGACVLKDGALVEEVAS